MEDYLLVSSIIFVIFGLLYFIPKENRQKKPTKALISYLAIISTTVLLASIYHNSTSVFGYKLQHNRGLLGGYATVGFTVSACILWLIIITIYNKRRQ